ncbi:unnamed protein product [Meloidogyne enterolobii]|uniref:Uncharacterized protein n=1 Tax=Meloidogyne enterolobii TaxID=390850 RepID=A0ACB1AFP9_MELEN
MSQNFKKNFLSSRVLNASQFFLLHSFNAPQLPLYTLFSLLGKPPNCPRHYFIYQTIYLTSLPLTDKSAFLSSAIFLSFIVFMVF